ncbi:keratin, type I cytoskeletal 10-like isoform X1 [Temnothorax curvispinosus]|uniref:Keratin, type I cytoskeletal 10-like isoform X1 n=1 Tax=Temnothorax curvispinosus TaxID=300111 RepID=A0A6J1PQS4_9HYME|nr:keratin, type I cytoskeletal 10-like isoform X1 [Temnothorax curvispinosus]XP_024871642.1 keratin, type I cytoskeletal 10-like isoform X1 [Temnothorax curvispinosus]
MRVLCAFCGLFLAVAIVNCSPVEDKKEAEDDLSPLNEVLVVEADEAAADDGERGDRDKRKIGIKLGVSNGIINFVFDKVDSFIDSKTKALSVLDESNKAKNAVFGIDNKHSATSEFLSKLVNQKIQAATGSIGPIINSATTFFSGASAGISKALAGKIAPLSSLSGGLSGGAGGGAGHGDASGGSSGSAFIGNLLTQKIGSLSSLSQSSGGLGSLSGGLGGLSGGSSGSPGSDSHSGTNGGAGGVSAGAGINLGAFGNLAGRSITTEDTPVFDRNRVALDIPSSAFGTGFTLVTNVSKVLSSVILNSARRTETLLEIFKPFFRGTFAIKGLPSDKPK